MYKLNFTMAFLVKVVLKIIMTYHVTYYFHFIVKGIHAFMWRLLYGLFSPGLNNILSGTLFFKKKLIIIQDINCVPQQ